MRVLSYPWPRTKKCAVLIAVLFDDGLDALAQAPDLAQRPKSYSVWEYGAKRGVERLLTTLADFDIITSWFIPGAVIEKHPSLAREIAQQGHEIAARGWDFEFYENLEHLSLSEKRFLDKKCSKNKELEHLVEPRETKNALEREQLLDCLKRSRHIIEDICQLAPRGFSLPIGHWPVGFDKVLKEANFDWSASLNGDDRPYSHKSGLVELPIHRELEDRPYFQFNFTPPFPKGLSRLPSYRSVLANWQAEFNAYREHSSCFILQIRPEMIATPGRIFILRELLHHIKSYDDVWWATGSQIADWHKNQNTIIAAEHPIEVFAAYRCENNYHDQ